MEDEGRSVGESVTMSIDEWRGRGQNSSDGDARVVHIASERRRDLSSRGVIVIAIGIVDTADGHHGGGEEEDGEGDDDQLGHCGRLGFVDT